jgi:hypothetical protein
MCRFFTHLNQHCKWERGKEEIKLLIIRTGCFISFCQDYRYLPDTDIYQIQKSLSSIFLMCTAALRGIEMKMMRITTDKYRTFQSREYS